MAYDANLLLFGTVGAETTVITTATNSAVVLVGRNRIVNVDARVDGTAGGTSPSLALVVQEGTTASGTAFTTVGTVPAITASMVSTTGGGTGPTTATFRTTKDYVRVVATPSTTSTFSGVEVRLRPTGEPAISGGNP